MSGMNSARLKSLFWAVGLLLLGQPVLGQQSVAQTARSADALVQEIEQFVYSRLLPESPGVALSIILDGRSELLKGFGVRKQGSLQLVDEDTVFRLASVSKTFASAAVGALVQKGVVGWDDKVTHHVGELKLKNKRYTRDLSVRHLLSHTSGLMPHAYTNLIEYNVHYPKMIRELEKAPFICPPGRCYAYQNVIYSVSGDVVASASKQKYEKVVEDLLFSPLNMRRASFGKKAIVSDENHAVPHAWSRKAGAYRPVNITRHYYRVAPAAGVNASIGDMQQWLRAQLGHFPEVLSKGTLTAMHSKQVKTTARQAHYRTSGWKPVSDVHYGLGWRLFDFSGIKNFVHHAGLVKGARAQMVFNADLQMGMVALVNSESREVKHLVPKFLELYLKHYPSATTLAKK